jgi:predicted exporter
VALIAMGVFVAQRLEVTTGLSQLLVDSPEHELALLSSRLVDSPLTRTMVLGLRAPRLDTVRVAAQTWAEELAQHPEVLEVRGGPDAEFQDAVYDLYYPRRLLFFSRDPERAITQQGSKAGLERAAQELRAQLASPQGDLIKGIAPGDPLLIFPRILKRFKASRQGEFEVVEGQFVDRERSTALLFLTTRHSAFDATTQGPFEDFLQASFLVLNDAFGGALQLERSGVHRFAVGSERRARRDLQLVSGFSMAGISLLFLAVFQSIRLLGVALLPLAGGLLTASCVGILAFGELHLMTLVFGATLVGVCIDYPIHYINHHALNSRANGPLDSLRSIWGAWVLGALTTVAGFAGLAGSAFPGIREIGVFAGAGVLGALVTTRFGMPALLVRHTQPSSRQAQLARLSDRALLAMATRKRVLMGIAASALALMAAGLPRLEWQDDVYSLSGAPPAEWIKEAEDLRRSGSALEFGRFVVAIGADEATALELNDEVFERLDEARRRGIIDDFRSLHPFLPSPALQSRNFTAFHQQPGFAHALHESFEGQGFRNKAFAEFERALQSNSPSPLTLADLQRSPLAPIANVHTLELDGKLAVLTLLEGVNEPAALSEQFTDLAGTYYFDQKAFLQGLYSGYRARATQLVGFGMIAVVGLLCLRKGGLPQALVTALPALIAAGTTLSILSLCGISINILHLLGLLLVLSIGVDYAIFLSAAGGDDADRATTLLSLCVACASTCLSFGLLALSSSPALRALGLTTSIGVLVSLAMAPIVALLGQPTRGESR